MADGNVVGIPLAVVGVLPVAELELGATMIVDGSHGSEVVKVDNGVMFVTPDSEGRLELESVTVVGGSVVSGGTVLLPVGTELLPEMIDEEVITGGSVKVDVALVPGSGIEVEVVRGGSGVTVAVFVSVAGMVEFEIGGWPGSLLVTSGIVVDVSVAVAGGSVTVGVSVEMPVPGPVMALDGIVLSVGDGSRMLEITELMSLRMEVSGLLGSEVLELVTMPVGAMTISDVLVVGTAGSSDVDTTTDDEVATGSGVVVVGSTTGVVVVGSATGVEVVGSATGVEVVGSATGVEVVGSATGLLVVSAAALLELLVGGTSLDEGCASTLVEVSTAEVSAVDVSAAELSTAELSTAELLLLVAASVDEALELSLDEELSDELWAAELLSDELSLEEELSEVLSVDEVESGVGVGGGGDT